MTCGVPRADGGHVVGWPAGVPGPDGDDLLPDSAEGADLAAAELAAGQLLKALGVALDSESLRGTPGRMARAYAELAEHRAHRRKLSSMFQSWW